MKFRSALALSASILALAMQPAKADPPGWYAGIGGGYSKLEDFNATATGAGVNVRTTFENGYGAMGFVGYNYGSLFPNSGPLFSGDIRAEGEFSFRQHNVNSITANGVSSAGPSGKLNTEAFMANGIYDFFPNSQWTPYIGAGIGIARLDAHNVSTAGTGTVINDVDTQFAYQGIAGVSYSIAPKLSLALDYRYFATLDPTFSVSAGAGGGTYSPAYRTHNVFLSLTYHFGPAPTPIAAPAPPPPAPVPPPAPRISLVFFDFDKAVLTPDGAKIVEQAASVYKAGGVGRIDLTGYTDLSGTQQYNLALSKRRADAVRAYLEKLGVPANAITEAARGKENPRVPTPDGVREPQNRRVEIVIP